MILVTGATGNVGAQLVRKLSERGEWVRAFVRDRTRAAKIALPEVELVEGDFSKPATFLPALDGVQRLFLCIPSSANVERQQKDFVDAARQRKVRHIVKLSQFGASEQSPARFQRYHGAVENYILKSGIRYTFLRPNLFMQGLLNFRSTITTQGALYAPAGHGKVSVIDVRDIAAVAEHALTDKGHEDNIYELTGPEALTHAEIAARLSEAVGKTIQHVDISPLVFKEALLSFGMPPWRAEGLVEDYDQYRNGEAAVVTTTVRDVTGKNPRTFGQFAEDYAREFQSKAVGA